MKNVINKICIIIGLYFVCQANIFAQPTGINLRGRQVFLSGINVAWGDFARDLTSNPMNANIWPDVLDKVSQNNGNCIRWWLHTNGAASPVFDPTTKLVTGPGPNAIVNMKRVLDWAYARGMLVNMCLFSFDLLQNQGQDITATKKLLEDTVATRAYINNALNPILAAIGNHPAVATWEIMNEGEGMCSDISGAGWAANKITMATLQKFTNKIAGAIHRHPNAVGVPVSTSTWNVLTMSDKVGSNRYTDEKLIAAGGDTQGFLDFYQIHYYDEYYGNAFSPFHNPKSNWNVDKPMVIGEFFISYGGYLSDFKPHLSNPRKSTTQCYKYGIDNGYAGVMGWAWTEGPGMTDEEKDTLYAATNFLYDNYKSLITVPGMANFTVASPLILKGTFPNIVAFKDIDPLEDLGADPSDYFRNVTGVPAQYNFTVADPSIADVVIDESSKKIKAIFKGKLGSTKVTVNASALAGQGTTQATFHVSFLKKNEFEVGFRKKVTSVNAFSEKFPLANINDGDSSTYGSTAKSDNQTIVLDLGVKTNINKVEVNWGNGFALQYSLQYSNTGISWTNLANVSLSTAEYENFIVKFGGKISNSFTAIDARYVRLVATRRRTDENLGYEIKEFQVFSTTATSTTDEELILKNIEIYPNPSNGTVAIRNQNSDDLSQVELVDLQGAKIMALNSIERFQSQEFDLTSLKSGFYLLRFKAMGNWHYKKLVKI